jgi:hypothetical protein
MDKQNTEKDGVWQLDKEVSFFAPEPREWKEKEQLP